MRCLFVTSASPVRTSSGREAVKVLRGILGQARRKGPMRRSVDVHCPCLCQDLVTGMSLSMVCWWAHKCIMCLWGTEPGWQEWHHSRVSLGCQQEVLGHRKKGRFIHRMSPRTWVLWRAQGSWLIKCKTMFNKQLLKSLLDSITFYCIIAVCLVLQPLLAQGSHQQGRWMLIQSSS